MDNQLIFTALFNKNPELLTQLFNLASDCRCNILETRVSTLNTDYALLMCLDGSWDSMAKMEVALENFRKQHHIDLVFKRSAIKKYPAHLLPYSAHIICHNKSGICASIMQFFIEQNIEINEIYASNYQATYTKTPMGMITLTVLIPTDTSLAHLRDNFMAYCDELNIDAILEPYKAT